MDGDQFLKTVGEAIGGDRAEAERATRATLAILAERIGADEARHLVPRLPPELGGWLFTAGPPRRFDVDEFVRRVAEREAVDPVVAQRHAGAVFLALARTLPDDEYAHLLARLPRNFAPLLAKGPYAGTARAEAFLATVAARAGVDSVDAWRVTEAVLETLAERIAPGEVDDLIDRLAPQLHPPLRRGRASSDDATRRMSVDEFLRRVAHRAEATPEEAPRFARAVFTVLRETLRAEYSDIVVQLPDEYWTLLAPDEPRAHR